VLLFDIDGTLVTTAGVGRRAIERAFERATSEIFSQEDQKDRRTELGGSRCRQRV